MPRLPAAYFKTWFRAELDGRRLPPRFGVVTACNPRGKIVSAGKNRVADKRLRAHLKKLGLRHFRVTGGNKAGTHREPGWGIVFDAPGEARALAARCRQLGYFWISSGRICLGATAGGPLRRAGAWRARRARWTR